MTLSEISIKNHVFAWMLMLALIVFGWISFNRMGVSQLPDVDFPVVSISLNLTGAAPEVMEMNVVDPIEGALTAIPGIETMSSTSGTGTARINLEFNLDKNIDVAVQEIQSAVNKVQRLLPTDMDPPVIAKTNSDDQPILWLSVTADNMSRRELMQLVQNQVQDRFSTLLGVGEVTLAGYVDPNLRVYLSQEKLDRYQLTSTDVVQAIQNEHSEKPGGRIQTSDNEINIRTLGEAPTPEDFGNISIARRGGGVNYAPIPLSAVAKIEDATADVRSISRSQGKVTVGVGIKKQPGVNAVEVAHEVKKKIKELQSQMPEGVQLGVRFDSTQFIEEAVGELNFTLVFSAILTALVCWLFLGSISATINVVLAIPTSIVGTFIVLNGLGFTLNTFTLLGLSLAIGIVVDDAIMVLENIVRHKEMGKTRVAAAMDGSREITGAAIAATIAIIAIFLPVAFMQGVIGKYFLQFGVTLSVSVALSLLEALTLTPMRCSRFLTVGARTSWIGRIVEGFFHWSSNAYRRIIPVTTNHPFLVVIVAILFFAGTLYFGTRLKQEFIPSEDQGRLSMRVQTPVGTSLAFIDRKMQEIEAYLMKRPEVDAYFSNIGGNQINSAFVFITLKPRKERSLSSQQLIPILRKDLTNMKDVKVVINDPSLSSLGGRRGTPVQFTVRGADFNELISESQAMMGAMEKSGLMVDIDTNYQAGMPEVQIIPDRVKARQYGVDVAEISNTINVMMAGAIAGKFSSQEGRRYDVRVSLPDASRTTVDIIKNLNVRNNRGELIPMNRVVTLVEKPKLQSISREDRSRAIELRANVAPGSSQAEALAKVEELAKTTLKPGYYAVIGGSAKTFQESFSGLFMALSLGILVSYMVLASQFNSFIHPVTILIALPFSVSGAFLALYLGGQTLNIYSMIGLILLMGIVKKNSILLVEFTNHKRLEGLPVKEAILEACPVRLRPILMTSVATIVGAIPPALAIGPGAESRIPMALTVIGGVLVSTVLTLFVVPSVYTIFSKLQREDKTAAEIKAAESRTPEQVAADTAGGAQGAHP